MENNRVERMFGPRENWGKGNERVETVQRATGNAGKPMQKKPGGGKRPDRCDDRGRKPEGQGEKKPIAGGISGFVSIHCGGCGKIVNTCLREKRTIFACRSCGHPNKLEKLTSIRMKCPRCGFTGNYRTNREDTEINMECLNCSEIVPMRRDRRGNYLPVDELESV